MLTAAERLRTPLAPTVTLAWVRPSALSVAGPVPPPTAGLPVPVTFPAAVAGAVDVMGATGLFEDALAEVADEGGVGDGEDPAAEGEGAAAAGEVADVEAEGAERPVGLVEAAAARVAKKRAADDVKGAV